jgi:hypothetical protein
MQSCLEQRYSPDMWRHRCAALLSAVFVAMCGCASEPENEGSAASRLPATVAVAAPFGVNQPPWVTPPAGAFRKASRAGLGWIRLFFDWNEIERSQGQVDWGRFGQAVEQAREQGLQVAVCLHNTPDWAGGDACQGCRQCRQDVRSAWRPRSPKYYYDFARRAARAFRGKVAAWELWQEPHDCTQWRGSAADYRDLILKPGFDGIRSVDRDAMILAPGLVTQDATALDPWITENRELVRPIGVRQAWRLDWR